MRMHRKIAVAATAVCLSFSLLGVAACSPQQESTGVPEKVQAQTQETQDESVTTDAKATDEKQSTASMPGDFQNKAAGELTETDFNVNFVNDGNRGCKACHADLWDVMNDLSPIQHVLTSAPGYGQTYNVTDCLSCHHYNVKAGGPKLSDILHSSHYANSTFTDDQNGNCWSCHATNLAGELVLWDLYKYTDELGGYKGSASDSMQMWLNLRTWNNNSVVDVVSDPEPAISVELSQPASDEKDMFVADNYLIPQFTAENFTMTVKGLGEDKTFTLADLQAMPQSKMVATQVCNTNAINGVLIGNVPVEGIKIEDFIEACGGLPEGITSMKALGDDQWNYTHNIQHLIDQGAMIALKYWDHDLTVDQGYPVTLFIPGMGGCFSVKWLSTVEFGSDEKAITGSWAYQEMFPDGFQGFICTGWFSPGEDGTEVKVGEPVAINGYAHVEADQGHRLSSIQFSADYGQHWIEMDIPESFDDMQWTYWEGTWTPEKAGTYVLHVKAIDEGGVEQYYPASVIVKAVE